MTKYTDYFKSSFDIARELRQLSDDCRLDRLKEIAGLIEDIASHRLHFEQLREMAALWEKGYAVRRYEISDDSMRWQFCNSQYECPTTREISEMIERGEVVKINDHVCIDIDKLRQSGVLIK